MKYYIRSNSFRRLFSFKRRSFDANFPIPYSSLDDDNDNNSSSEASLSPVHVTKPSWKCFTFDEISDATGNFTAENLVGKGGYAEVYRGVLKNGAEIAVKRLAKAAADERKEKDFLTEIGTICHVSHPNVLPLLGCCIDNGLYLIFSFSWRGTVASLLHDASLPPMEWKTRYKIAVGTASGLHYLHKGCQRRIIHRDIKSSNILLTADFEPQISDFGLAKWLPSQWTHHSIAPIEGTFGHLAPEYYLHGIVDEKTDVFAFGVFLLEIISGKRPVDSAHQSLHTWNTTSPVDRYFHDTAKPLLKKGEVEKLIDPRLVGRLGFEEESQVRRLAMAASLCIRASPTWRPTMTEVLEVLVEGWGEKSEERWKMAEKEEEEEEGKELWGFEELEYECDHYDSDDQCHTQTCISHHSPPHSISIPTS